MPHLLTFGHGYVAQHLAPLLLAQGWEVTGTTRGPARDGPVILRTWSGADLGADLQRASHVLLSVPPGPGGDPVLAALGDAIGAARPGWLGYLSTTGVYGDHGGGWVDEDTPTRPDSDRGQARLDAETGWRALADRHGLALHVFRLPGIYGPGRSAFDRLRAGTARRIVKPGQVFSRIHVADIARALAASMAAGGTGGTWNLADDLPAPPQDVIAHAAELLGLPPPPEIAFDEADLSPMARSFYGESKRVSADRIKADLGLTWRYRDYRAGLAAILATETA